MTRAESLTETAGALARILEPGDLDATLSRITAAAVELVPRVAYASITVRHGDDSLETVAATDDVLGIIDGRQYELREGPCYEAATSAAHVVAPDLAQDPRFPRYGAVALEHGVRAQAGLRLFDRNRSQGALNLYSVEVGAFADLDQVAVLFRSQAAVALAYAQEVTNLEEALATRTVIGKAIGIVMERYKLNDERAFAFLTRLSQHRNIKLRLVAEELVTEALGNADVAANPRGTEE